MGTTKKTYLELQLYKFVRLNKNQVRREFKNHYYFKGVGVVLHFIEGGYIRCYSIPFCVVSHSTDIIVTSIPELIYKLVKHQYLPITLTDLKYKPFNYTQTQLKLFTEYELKLIELRKEHLLELAKNDLKHYENCALMQITI